MKKLFSMLTLLLVFTVFLTGALNISALADNLSLIDTSDIYLKPQDEEIFNKDVADDGAFFELATEAAKHKGKEISFDGVHSGKSIKLFGIENSENILQSIYDCYKETGAIKNIIGKDYSVLKLYVNKDNEYVDALVFTKQENLPQSTAKNGWVELGSGSLILKDDLAVKYSDSENLQKLLSDDIGLKDIENLKFISSIPNMPVSLYFTKNNYQYYANHFLSPKDANTLKALKVYKVSDVCESYLKPILDFQNENAKKYANLDVKDRPSGTPQIPDEMPAVSPIDLDTYFDTFDVKAEKPETQSNGYLVLWICLGAVVLIAGGIVIYKKASKNT